MLLGLILVCEPPDEMLKGLHPVAGLLLGAAGRGWRWRSWLWLGRCLLPHTRSFQLSQPPGMETVQVHEIISRRQQKLKLTVNIYPDIYLISSTIYTDICIISSTIYCYIPLLRVHEVGEEDVPAPGLVQLRLQLLHLGGPGVGRGGAELGHHAPAHIALVTRLPCYLLSLVPQID